MLTYSSKHHNLIGYTDADGASQEHHKAISGQVFLIDGRAISWKSQKQELIMLSTTKAEYVATMHATKEAIWLQWLLQELFPTSKLPITLYCNNQSAIKLTQGDNYHTRTKHIDIQYHFICDAVRNGLVSLTYCPTEDMVTDILTKPLPKWKVAAHIVTLGFCLT